MGQWKCVPEGVLVFNSSFSAFGGEQSLLLCCTVWYGTREAEDWLAPPVQANDPPDTLFTQFLSALDSFQWAWRLQPLDFEEVVLNCIRHSSPIRHQQFLHIKFYCLRDGHWEQTTHTRVQRGWYSGFCSGSRNSWVTFLLRIKWLLLYHFRLLELEMYFRASLSFTTSFLKIKATEGVIRTVFCLMKAQKEKLKEPEANLISLDFYFASASFTRCLEQKSSLASTV